MENNHKKLIPELTPLELEALSSKSSGLKQKDNLSPAEQFERLKSQQVDLGFRANAVKLVKKYCAGDS